MPALRVSVILAGLIFGTAAFAGLAQAADTIRLAILKTGTFAWELAVMRAHGLDQAAGLDIQSTELATPEAVEVALNAGAADVIVSDWLWVSRARQLGDKLVFYPYSSALGAVMVPQDSSIRTLADLKGKKLAVAGGPLDKSWLLLRGAAKLEGLDLASQASIAYGAPALLAEKTLQGEMDATLNFWNFCAALEAKGMRRLVGIDDLLPKLGIKGRPALLGYIFREDWAQAHPRLVDRFIEATRQAKERLASSDEEWQRVAPLLGTNDPATLAIFRTRYRQGIPRRPIAQEEEDAQALFSILANLGGKALVGDATELAPGTFYKPAS
ncbi:MAG: ABC transporter substrate-binding protein [Methylobacteriaceae bacterium]|nr:ABC transporter substrate-binding protein [Methylobacteriaceae bacterium]MBV9633742.1 ABC transporter substrate-binding protein [Methylobacteriaceae bacterium]